MRPKPLLVSLLCCVLLAHQAAAASPAKVPPANASPPRAIRRSDVVFMYDNPKLYETYGCTVLGWAGRAERRHIQRAHAKGVRAFSASVGFRTEFRRVIDFHDDFLDAACRNFAGGPFIVPWLWDHKYKDQPAWWWCTNSPLYRKYLDARLVEIMKTRPTGLHIDDYTGTAGTVTWRSGCFCRYCTAGFRDYLAHSVPKKKLTELGIDDLSAFDYRKFLLEKGVKPEEYNKRRGGLPLAAEFYDYHVKVNNAFVAAYRRRAEELRGGPLTLSVNSSLTQPDRLLIAPHLSYFCCEVRHEAWNRTVARHPIYIYKLADALARPVTSTASGQDWAYVMEHKLPCLVRTWTALSYAFGHNLMAPHRQWCYNKEKGTHWYDGPTEEYAWLYRFVRDHARLLDGYEAAAPVAVVYDNAARRKGRANIEPICLTLAQENVPFAVVAAGDDWLDYRLDAQELSKFKAVIVAAEPEMDQPQRKLIERVRNDGRLVVWPDDGLVEKLVGRPVTVDGSEHVGVVVRARRGESSPMVVHLLNRDYNGQKDAMNVQQRFTVRLRRDLLSGREIAKASLHAPQAEPVALKTGLTDRHVVVVVPRLDLWGIVELELARE